jgi:quaternary ammonium compound-resistance protein SugE
MPQSMPWLFLLIAGVLEIAWAIGLKYSQGFSRPLPTALTLVAMAASMYLLSMAVRTLPVGTAYAVWTGIGAAGTALLGIMLLGESASPWRLVCIGLIVLGILGLKLAAGEGGSAAG